MIKNATLEYVNNTLTKTIQHPWTWDWTVGTIGMLFVLFAYGLVSQKDIKSDGYAYHVMNFIGGICLGINALASHVFPLFILELFWVSISIINFINIRHDIKFDTREKGEAP